VATTILENDRVVEERVKSILVSTYGNSPLDMKEVDEFVEALFGIDKEITFQEFVECVFIYFAGCYKEPRND